MFGSKQINGGVTNLSISQANFAYCSNKSNGPYQNKNRGTIRDNTQAMARVKVAIMAITITLEEVVADLEAEVKDQEVALDLFFKCVEKWDTLQLITITSLITLT